MGGTGGGRRGNVDFRRRPLEGHAKKISNVPRSRNGQAEFQSNVSGYAGENGSDADADEHF